jgi:hypothetical protein
LVWPLEILALVSLGLATAIAIKRKRASIGRIAIGAGCATMATFAAWASSGLPAIVVAALGKTFPTAVDPPMRAWIALVASATAAGSVALVAFARDDEEDDDTTSSWIGALAILAILSIVVAAKLPAGSYLFTLPVLFGALFVGVAASIDRSRTSIDRSRTSIDRSLTSFVGRWHAWIVWVLAAKSFALAAILWMPFVRVLLVMVGAGVPAMTVLPVAMLVLCAAPLVVAQRGWTRAVVPAIAGAIALGAAMAVAA